MTPFIIVGGILLGWFTATESACVAVLYSAVLSTFFYRETGVKRALQRAARHRAAGRRGAVLRRHRQRVRLAAGLLPDPAGAAGQRHDLGHGPDRGGFFIAFCFLVVGCFLDAIPAIIIVGTVLQPLAKSVDMHPVQFAIISIVSLAFGLVTPPYGLCLMIACAVAGVRLRYALKDTAIMLVPMLLVLAALIVWPDVSLFLPRLIVPEMLK